MSYRVLILIRSPPSPEVAAPRGWNTNRKQKRNAPAPNWPQPRNLKPLRRSPILSQPYGARLHHRHEISLSLIAALESQWKRQIRTPPLMKAGNQRARNISTARFRAGPAFRNG